MLKLCRVTKVKVLFLVLVYVFNFNLFKVSAAILRSVVTSSKSGRHIGQALPLRVWFSTRVFKVEA